MKHWLLILFNFSNYGASKRLKEKKKYFILIIYWLYRRLIMAETEVSKKRKRPIVRLAVLLLSHSVLVRYWYYDSSKMHSFFVFNLIFLFFWFFFRCLLSVSFVAQQESSVCYSYLYLPRTLTFPKMLSCQVISFLSCYLDFFFFVVNYYSFSLMLFYRFRKFHALQSGSFGGK